MNERVANLGAAIGSSGSAIVSAAASVCCIGPLAITLLGVNGAILAAGFKPYRLHLLALSAALLAIAFWAVYRRGAKGSRACSTRGQRLTRTILWGSVIIWIGAALVQFIVYPYWVQGGVL